jgi:hypothetical protein
LTKKVVGVFFARVFSAACQTASGELPLVFRYRNRVKVQSVHEFGTILPNGASQRQEMRVAVEQLLSKSRLG